MSSKSVPGHARLAPLLAGLAMLGPFSIDTMFPAFAQIGAEFGANSLAVQQTLSAYLGAYALMSLVHGPLSDTFGRRRVIIGGLLIFLLASIGCALAPSLPVLLAFRLLQGASAGVGMIVGRAIVRDCYAGADAQRLMSNITMMFSIAPALAPIIGGWVLGLAGWHAIFWFLTLFASVILLTSFALLPETHAHEHRVGISPRGLVRTYGEILRDPSFQPLALSGAFNFGALFLYISSAPAYVFGLLHLDENRFGWLFVPAIGGMLFGAMLSGRMAGRVSAERTVRIGYQLMLVAATLSIVLALFSPLPMLPWSVLLIGFGAIGISLCSPTITLLILDRFPRYRGAASSMQAVVSLLYCTLLAGVISPLISGSALWLAIGAATQTVLGFVTWLWFLRVGKRELDAHSCASAHAVAMEEEAEPQA